MKTFKEYISEEIANCTGTNVAGFDPLLFKRLIKRKGHVSDAKPIQQRRP